MKIVGVLTVVVLVTLGTVSMQGVVRANTDPFITIDDPGGATFPNGINARGDIVGTYYDRAGRKHGFLRDAQYGTYLSIDDPNARVAKCRLALPQDADFGTSAAAINQQGQIVGQYNTRDGECFFHTHTFLVHRDSLKFSTIKYPIPNPESVSSDGHIDANGINALGDIVGTCWFCHPYSPHGNCEYEGFLLHQGAYTAIEYPGSVTCDESKRLKNGVYGTEAYGLNGWGDIVGTYYYCPHSTCTNRGFLLHHMGVAEIGSLQQHGAFTSIDDPNAGQIDQRKKDAYEWGTYVRGINGFGAIVGYYVDKTGHDHGFLLKRGKYLTIDATHGVKGTRALGINDQGDIVGDYTDVHGNTHGFLLRWQSVQAGLYK